MTTEKRQFTVLFTDGSKKDFTGDDATVIYIKALWFLLQLKKDFRIDSIIDEANAKLYVDFEWDLTYSQKDLDYLVTGPKTYTALDVERMVLGYARHIAANVDYALKWVEDQRL